MNGMTIDPTFYRSAAEAAAAPAEELAYVVAFDRENRLADAMSVVDVNPASDSYGQVVGWTEVGVGEELHHFGWNACSSALKHEGHDMAGLARRYLLVPGIRSSKIYVLDIGPDPRQPQLVRTIDAARAVGEGRLFAAAHAALRSRRRVLDVPGRPRGRSRRPERDRAARPRHLRGGAAPGRLDRGPQHLSYDAWWHLNRNVLISSEWGTPSMIEDGVIPELLLGQKYGHAISFLGSGRGQAPPARRPRRRAPDGARGPPLA